MMASQMGIKINFRSMTPVDGHPVALIFPDQCSRSLRLLSAARNLPGVSKMLEAATRALGFDPLQETPIQGIWELFRGPEAIPVWMEETSLCQPVMFVSAMAAVERLKERHPTRIEHCRAVAGLSLGELSALTFAGVFDFETGLELARIRGLAMQEAAEESAQRMLSVAGLDSNVVEQLCTRARQDPNDVCQIAQRLFEDGFVCAGSAQSIDRLLSLCRTTKGCKQVTLLKASGSGGFHTPLMASARERYLEALNGFRDRMQPPQYDVYLGVKAERILAGSSPDRIIDLLADQLVNCALWEQTVREMLGNGIVHFCECGPMQQLKGIMKRIDSDAFSTMISVDHLVKNTKDKPGD